MDDPTGQVDTVSSDNVVFLGHSLMLTFAKTVAGGGEIPIAIIPASRDGSPLLGSSGWLKPAGLPAGCAGFPRDRLYGSAIFRVCTQGYEHPIRGVIWFQGENEATQQTSSSTLALASGSGYG